MAIEDNTVGACRYDDRQPARPSGCAGCLYSVRIKHYIFFSFKGPLYIPLKLSLFNFDIYLVSVAYVYVGN
jgi:hypothetical protein